MRISDWSSDVCSSDLTAQAPASLESMFSALKDKQAIEYPLVVKADTQGSVEAIVGSINKISTEDIKAGVLHSGVGGITERELTMSGTWGAPIIGVKGRPHPTAREVAVRQGGGPT